MKRVAASEQTVPIPPVVEVAVVQVELPIVGVAPEVERLRVAVGVAYI